MLKDPTQTFGTYKHSAKQYDVGEEVTVAITSL
jgi:hypothetical protein